MKLTGKQQKDLETILYFMPDECKKMKISGKDIERFFEYSDNWRHKDKINQRMFLYPVNRIKNIMENWNLNTVPAFKAEWVGTIVYESWMTIEEFDDWRWFNALCEAKRWRGIHMELYEQWILEGSTPIYTLLVDFAKRKWYQFWKPTYVQFVTPRSVVEFMKKELFKWASASSIEYTYNQILWKNSTR